MEKTAVINGKIITPDGLVTDKAVWMEGGKVVALPDTSDVPENVSVVDAGGHYIAPGLIDLQIYGSGGYLFAAEPTDEAWNGIADALVRTGTTSFMMTLATNTAEVFDTAISVAHRNSHPAVLGLHFEGPWLNPQKKGAHPEDCIVTPDLPMVEQLLERAGDALGMVTLAPERVDPEIIRLLVARGVLVSAGHSNATFTQAMDGFRNGITAVTHLFNAMSAFHHRDTGLPGATFQSDACASIIADGIHVDYQALAVSKRLLGERLFLITDAVEESHTGIYRHIRRGDRFTLPDGTLSGSSLTLLQAIANCVLHAGVELEEAVRMATLYPARLIGADDLGRIEPGAVADLILFDDHFRLKEVWLKGIRQKLPGRQ